MNGLKKLPKYFSLAAVFVSTIMVMVKGITPIRAVYRVASAALAFYFLGLYISRMLIKDNKKEKIATSIDIIAGTQEEFEELNPPVVEATDQDVLGRG